jgi:hypothetical protein
MGAGFAEFSHGADYSFGHAELHGATGIANGEDTFASPHRLRIDEREVRKVFPRNLTSATSRSSSMYTTLPSKYCPPGRIAISDPSSRATLALVAITISVLGPRERSIGRHLYRMEVTNDVQS